MTRAFNADQVTARPDVTTTRPLRVAVVGVGPRGLSIVERLVARLIAAGGRSIAEALPSQSTARLPAVPVASGSGEPRVTLQLIDMVEVGAGRIWRTDQPDWFLMNTMAGEISAFSGPPDGGPDRPGAGPSFAQWWDAIDPGVDHAAVYAPRALYGRYLRHLLDTVEAALPAWVRLDRITGRVRDLRRDTDGCHLSLDDGTRITVDRAVLTTGHPRPELVGEQRRLAMFATGRPGLTYIRGDSAADMPLGAVAPGSRVGVLGLGLSFYDVMAALTIGRGGRFIDADPDRLSAPRGAPGGGAGTDLPGLVYRPSGREPLLLVGCRSGMPQRARGRNQKAADYSHIPVLFTPTGIRNRYGDGPLDFRTHILPWLLAETRLVYYLTALRRRGRGDEMSAFVAQVVRAASQPPAEPAAVATGRAGPVGQTPGVGAPGAPDVAALARSWGLDDLPELDFDTLALPFAGRTFASPAAFDAVLTEELAHDLRLAEEGNVDSPTKAALDLLRSLRWIIRELADFGGLTPGSHRHDLVDWYSARSSFLAAGPPRIRLRQLLALRECGLVRIVGPETRFTADPESGLFTVESPVVAGSRAHVETLVDARIPSPDLSRDQAELTRNLRARGVLTEYVNGVGAEAFRTGGVAVTRSPFHPIGADGEPDASLHVIGIPSEHTRWFMQVVATGPRAWSDFMANADEIAAALLRPHQQTRGRRRANGDTTLHARPTREEWP